MSDVEQFYVKLCAKWGKPCRPWNELHPDEQLMFVQGINMIMVVLG
jgi:hypothetical protein